jgi:DNA-directed RNA polymerase
MESRWATYLGRKVHENSQIALRKPMQLLQLFENVGKIAEKEERFLGWKTPLIGFEVVQYYAKGRNDRVWVDYGEDKIHTNICVIEDLQYMKGKQSICAAPNLIHSLDAAHLQWTIYKADFPITTIHDSFGCLLADMPKLYKLVRETFVELYMEDPFEDILKQLGVEETDIEMGKLDIKLILESEYAFA